VGVVGGTGAVVFVGEGVRAVTIWEEGGEWAWWVAVTWCTEEEGLFESRDLLSQHLNFFICNCKVDFLTITHVNQ
jgi:hypothetical protein